MGCWSEWFAFHQYPEYSGRKEHIILASLLDPHIVTYTLLVSYGGSYCIARNERTSSYMAIAGLSSLCSLGFIVIVGSLYDRNCCCHCDCVCYVGFWHQQYLVRYDKPVISNKLRTLKDLKNFADISALEEYIYRVYKWLYRCIVSGNY